MTDPKGNSEFCFPETLNVPRGEAEGNIKGKNYLLDAAGKQICRGFKSARPDHVRDESSSCCFPREL